MRHFYPDSDGNCSICPENVPGTIEHILTQCPSLSETREKLYEKLNTYNISENAKSLISTAIHSTNNNDTVQFLLDCSTTPEVISETQQIGPVILEELFRYTRAWCYSIHKSRLKLQGRWTNLS